MTNLCTDDLSKVLAEEAAYLYQDWLWMYNGNGLGTFSAFPMYICHVDRANKKVLNTMRGSEDTNLPWCDTNSATSRLYKPYNVTLFKGLCNLTSYNSGFTSSTSFTVFGGDSTPCVSIGSMAYLANTYATMGSPSFFNSSYNVSTVHCQYSTPLSLTISGGYSYSFSKRVCIVYVPKGTILYFMIGKDISIWGGPSPTTGSGGGFASVNVNGSIYINGYGQIYGFIMKKVYNLLPSCFGFWIIFYDASSGASGVSISSDASSIANKGVCNVAPYSTLCASGASINVTAVGNYCTTYPNGTNLPAISAS